MFNKVRAVPSETPDLPNQQAPNQTGPSRFRKKRYAAMAAVFAIAIIAVAFFIPQGQATIPLSVDYAIGEKMMYDNTITMTLQSYNLGTSTTIQPPNSTTVNGQQTIEVAGFDGENYLLNHTTTMTVLDRSISFSMTEKMNKTGYSTYLLNVGSNQTEIPTSGLTGDSFLAQLLSKPEVKVGDTISIPYPTVSSNIQTTGDLTIKINGVEDLTVPAGTYKVFRIDMTSNNLKMTLNPPTTNSSVTLSNGLRMSISINSQIYLEYGTMRQIKSTMQETSSYQSSMLNMTIQMTMDMTLKQHIKP
jgi:hypothetical protein